MSEREKLIAVANSYLQQGLLEHKPQEVLFADHCVRYEMGYQTGGNARQLRELLSSDSYKSNKAIHDKQWVVEAPWLDVRFTLELDNIEQTMRVATRFKIVDGLIEHIEILFNAGPLQQMIVDSIQVLRTDIES